MRRAHLLLLMALVVAMPAATAGSFFASNGKPCFVSGRIAYQLSDSTTATHIVRVDNMAANPSLRMQIVDNPALADFVLADDGQAANACISASAIESIHVDPVAPKPELTVSLSRNPAAYKIYVKSSRYSEQDAAALFAVIWRDAEATGSVRISAKRD